MNYIPVIKKDKETMLKTIGLSSVDGLFKDIPHSKLLKDNFNLQKGLSEFELIKKLNVKSKDKLSFLGGGSYNHYIPSTVNSIISLGEFYTAYTPYQPEISQGTLQAIFEYQSMLCELTGMDVANASMYDGASSIAEAMLMATRIKGNKKVLVSKTLNPIYREVLKTYAWANSIDLKEINYNNGVTDMTDISGTPAAIILQNPNFFGQIENLKAIKKFSNDSMLITSTTETLSWAMLKPFYEFGVDIVTGEGQSFGNGMNFGGPGLGIMAVKSDYTRILPGRIVGKTKDTKENPGYVLTLCTREQHIRREKATSNICSNEGLCALSAAVYLGTLGPNLKKLAEYNHKLAVYFSKQIKPVFTGPFFNEFVIKTENDDVELLDLEKYYPELKGHKLVCVTEQNTLDDIDKAIQRLK